MEIGGRLFRFGGLRPYVKIEKRLRYRATNRPICTYANIIYFAHYQEVRKFPAGRDVHVLCPKIVKFAISAGTCLITLSCAIDAAIFFAKIVADGEIPCWMVKNGTAPKELNRAIPNTSYQLLAARRLAGGPNRRARKEDPE